MTEQTKQQCDAKILEPSDNPLLCTDCSIHMIWDNRLAIKRQEYERLKRLDENRKKEIERFKNQSIDDSVDDKQELINAFIELLESLDK